MKAFSGILWYGPVGQYPLDVNQIPEIEVGQTDFTELENKLYHLAGKHPLKIDATEWLYYTDEVFDFFKNDPITLDIIKKHHGSFAVSGNGFVIYFK